MKNIFNGYMPINKRLKLLLCVILTFVMIGVSMPVHALPSPVVAEGIVLPAASLNNAPINPDFIKYQEDLCSGKIFTTVNGFYTGYVPSPVDLSHMTGKKILAYDTGVLSYPSSYDLRTLGKVTPVKDQGPAGTCWAFGTYSALESYLLPNEYRDFSENNLKNNAGFDMDKNNGGGNMYMSTAYLARWSGPMSENDDPYDPYTTVSPSGVALQKHVQDVLFIPPRGNSTDNDNLKWALMNYGAVETRMCWNSSCYDSINNSFYKPTTFNEGGHIIAIVGWDDNFDKNKFRNVPPANGAFIIKNSWSEYWGDDGYFYVSYYDTSIGVYNAVFTAEPNVNYNNIYQYDPLGWATDVGYGTDTAWFANAFYANGNEKLKAVGFYTSQVNSTYDILVYNNTGYQGHTAGMINVPGYHTIPLGSAIQLSPGEEFDIMVNLTTPGYDYPIAIEYPFSDYCSGARANASEGFISYDGSYWTDITTIPGYDDTSICLKAYTDDPAGTVTGRVVINNTTTGIGNAYVAIVNVNNTGEIYYSSTTDAYGNYQFTDVKSTDGQAMYRTYASKEPYGDGWSAPFSLAPEGMISITTPIILPPASIYLSTSKPVVYANGTDSTSVSAYVTNVLGSPVDDGYEVFFWLNDTRPGFGSLGPLGTIPSDTYAFADTSGGYASAVFGNVTAGGINLVGAFYLYDSTVNASVAIPLNTTGFVSGSVTLASGEMAGIGGADVRIVNASNENQVYYQTVSDAYGYYYFSGVNRTSSPNAYKIYANKSPYGGGYSSAFTVNTGEMAYTGVVIFPGPGRIELSADNSSLAANGMDYTNVTAHVYDALGNPAADGYIINFSLVNASPAYGSLGSASSDGPSGNSLEVEATGGTAKLKFGWAASTGINTIIASYVEDPNINASIDVALNAPVLDTEYVSDDISSTMILWHNYSPSVTFKNTGTSPWTESSKVRLAVWGNNNPGLGLNGNCVSESGYNEYSLPTGITVMPGDDYTWHINMTPNTEGGYWVGIGMVKDSATPQFFGQQSYAFPYVWQGSLDSNVVSAEAPDLPILYGSYTVNVTMHNNGTAVWTENSKVRLAIWGNDNQGLGLGGDCVSESGYKEYTLPAGTNVMPGDDYTWHINMTPNTEGGYWVGIGMVKDAVSPWFFGQQTYAFPYVWMGMPDATVEVSCPELPAVYTPMDVTVTANNTGSAVWTEDSHIRLAVWGNDPAGVGLSGDLVGESGYNEYVLPSGVKVYPGESYTWHMNVTPTVQGGYWLGFGMVKDSASPWFFGSQPYAFPYVWLGMPDQTYVSDTIPDSMTAGQTYHASITFLNTGSAVWTEYSKMRLAVWGNNNVLGLDGNCTSEAGYAEYSLPPEIYVMPGQEYTWNLDITPTAPGNYWLGLSPMQDKTSPWFYGTPTYKSQIVTG